VFIISDQLNANYLGGEIKLFKRREVNTDNFLLALNPILLIPKVLNHLIKTLPTL
jgi:hypothetical protein